MSLDDFLTITRRLNGEAVLLANLSRVGQTAHMVIAGRINDATVHLLIGRRITGLLSAARLKNVHFRFPYMGIAGAPPPPGGGGTGAPGAAAGAGGGAPPGPAPPIRPRLGGACSIIFEAGDPPPAWGKF